VSHDVHKFIYTIIAYLLSLFRDLNFILHIITRVSETFALFLYFFPDQDVKHMKFHLSNISTGEGHAWRWAPNKTSNS